MFNIMCLINLQAQKLFFNYFHLQIEELKTNTNIETILYLLNSHICLILNFVFVKKVTGQPVNFVIPVKFVTCYKSVQGLAISTFKKVE